MEKVLAGCLQNMSVAAFGVVPCLGAESCAAWWPGGIVHLAVCLHQPTGQAPGFLSRCSEILLDVAPGLVEGNV